MEAGGEFSVEVTLGSNGRGPRAFYLVLSDDEELVALKKVIVGGAKCEASLAVEAPDEACEWSLVLRAVFDGARASTRPWSCRPFASLCPKPLRGGGGLCLFAGVVSRN